MNLRKNEEEKQIAELNERLNIATEIIEDLLGNIGSFTVDYSVIDTAKEFLKGVKNEPKRNK